LIVCVVLSALNCSSDPQGPRIREFIIEVDSLQAPVTISRDEPLEIQFYGTIGPDLCYVFDRFAAEQTNTRIDLRLWGRHEVLPDRLCPLAISELGGRAFVKPPPHEDTVTIVVHQPDDSTLERVVGLSD
jgi:hypothetical protein